MVPIKVENLLKCISIFILLNFYRVSGKWAKNKPSYFPELRKIVADYGTIQ